MEARRAFLALEQFRKFFITAILILASEQISSDGVGNLKAESILVPESLAETLWRLEEARLGFRPKSMIQVEEALEWVVSRQGLEGSYMNLFAGTEKDMLGVQLPTGERIESAALRHILGEEALRATILWKLESSNNVRKAINGFNH